MKKKESPKEKENETQKESKPCSNCGASNVKLYQFDLCKGCLLDRFKEIKVEFKKLRIAFL
ncbi:hypothetical protein [Leptospira ilyithenensis]|uniref:Uncharacterized protein n=1 Tax=Leptospira ilyithenensis TaxID=2484901 RepID=A0A4R9LPB1_9LEPT|nr:hypothetical protein [Leptospira ilyithenensis]TGN09780.1 hypothetical protein EHS11_11905 [Leptospira ilyithenensis]